MAELVVARFLFRVAQNLVGLGSFLELLSGSLLVLRVHIWMVLAGQLPEGLLDIRLRGSPADAQHLVVISLSQSAHSQNP